MPIGCKRATTPKLVNELSSLVSLSRIRVPSGNERAVFMKQPTRLTSDVFAFSMPFDRSSTISAAATNWYRGARRLSIVISIHPTSKLPPAPPRFVPARRVAANRSSVESSITNSFLNRSRSWLVLAFLLFFPSMEITAQQISVLERLKSSGFDIVAFPMYESYVGVRKGNCAALLAPQDSGGFQMFGQPSYLVDGKLGVKTFQGDGHYFVSKKEKLAATPERTKELDSFEAELAENLLPRA